MNSGAKTRPNMTEKGAALKSARDDRLAAALRENLKRRRKAAKGQNVPGAVKDGGERD